MAIHVADMPGRRFHDQLEFAIDVARQNNGGTVVISPGWYRIQGTIAIDFDGLHIVGQNASLFQTAANSAIFELLSPSRLKIERLLLKANADLAGAMGIWWHANYGVNQNGSHQVEFERLTFSDNLECGAWVGDPLGPDFRGWTFSNCLFYNVGVGIVVEGANVTAGSFRDGAMANFRRAGVRLKKGGGEFAAGGVCDPWGNAWSVDRYDTAAWRQRCIGNGFAKGGNPFILLDNVDLHGPPQDAGEQIYAIESEGGVVHARKVRCEGKRTGIYRTIRRPALPMDHPASRLHSVFEHCSTSTKDVDVFCFCQDGGEVITILGGWFAGANFKRDDSVMQISDETYMAEKP